MFCNKNRDMRKTLTSHSAVSVPHREFQAIRARLLEQGFEDMKMRGSGGRSSFRPSAYGVLSATSPMLPALTREVLERVVGPSVDRFTFDTKDQKQTWNVKVKFSRKTDERALLLVKAFEYKDHKHSKNLYEACIVPDPNDVGAVTHLDELRSLLSSLESDDEIRKAADAAALGEVIPGVGKNLRENVMVPGFQRYVEGFVKHCSELWDMQIHRLGHDPLAQQVMKYLCNRE
jgi:hypothetical protein